jgi:hypothetical protein
MVVKTRCGQARGQEKALQRIRVRHHPPISGTSAALSSFRNVNFSCESLRVCGQVATRFCVLRIPVLLTKWGVGLNVCSAQAR